MKHDMCKRLDMICVGAPRARSHSDCTHAHSRLAFLPRQDVCETDCMDEQLDEMFGPEAPPLLWDTRGAYKRDKVELYYEVSLCAEEGRREGWRGDERGAEGLRRASGDKRVSVT